jgi:hypothetical protein
VLQTDGFRFHRVRWKFEWNVRNDQRLLAVDWVPIHASWLHLRDESDRVIAPVLRKLDEGQRRADAA